MIGDNLEIANELEDAKNRIESIMDEVNQLLMKAGGIHQTRARSYWYAHIRSALSDDHEFLGGSMCKMSDTINELREDEDEYEDE